MTQNRHQNGTWDFLSMLTASMACCTSWKSAASSVPAIVVQPDLFRYRKCFRGFGGMRSCAACSPFIALQSCRQSQRVRLGTVHSKQTFPDTRYCQIDSAPLCLGDLKERNMFPDMRAWDSSAPGKRCGSCALPAAGAPLCSSPGGKSG